tara:strand:- start:1072 stop:1371 length:300 start_codon:yes stop_codon:yes gene_type:complete
MGDLYFAPNRDFKNDPEAIELIEKALSGEVVTHQMGEVELRETLKTLLFQLEMMNRGMGNFGRQLHETKEYMRMPQDWKPEAPKRPSPPQQKTVTKKGE